MILLVGVFLSVPLVLHWTECKLATKYKHSSQLNVENFHPEHVEGEFKKEKVFTEGHQCYTKLATISRIYNVYKKVLLFNSFRIVWGKWKFFNSLLNYHPIYTGFSWHKVEQGAVPEHFNICSNAKFVHPPLKMGFPSFFLNWTYDLT